MEKKHILQKLHSKSGETITETLVAMLIVALGALFFAGMTVSSTNIVKKTEDAMMNYYQNLSDLAKSNAGTTYDGVVQYLNEQGTLTEKLGDVTEDSTDVKYQLADDAEKVIIYTK